MGLKMFFNQNNLQTMYQTYVVLKVAINKLTTTSQGIAHVSHHPAVFVGNDIDDEQKIAVLQTRCAYIHWKNLCLNVVC